VQAHEDPFSILLAKIRTEALREVISATEGDGVEKLLRSSLFERFESSMDDCHLLERWVTGELIRMNASGKY